MDIFASLTQLAGNGATENADVLATLNGEGASLLGEEFGDLTEVLAKLTGEHDADETLETDDPDSVVVPGADILTEMIEKMTGMTASVAEPQEPTDGDDITKTLLAGSAKQANIWGGSQDRKQSGLQSEQLALPDTLPETLAENSFLEPFEDNGTVSAPEARPSAQPLNSHTEQSVKASLKSQDQVIFAADLSKATSSESSKIEAKADMVEAAPIDPVRNAVAAEVVSKSSTALIAEPRVIASHISAPEAVAPDAVRAQAENRQVQINPPAVFRQITDTVVTMRDEMVEIRLSPEELGRVRMVLTGQDRAPHLTIWVDRPEVLEQMRRQGDSLLQQLREQGMSGASLDFRDGRQAQDDTNQDQNFWSKQGNDPKDRPLMVLPEASGRSLMTPFLSGRHGINIKV